MFAWLKSRGRFLRLFDIVIAPSIAQCSSGDPVGPSKFTRDAKAPDGQPPRGLLFIMRPQRPRAWRRALSWTRASRRQPMAIRRSMSRQTRRRKCHRYGPYSPKPSAPDCRPPRAIPAPGQYCSLVLWRCCCLPVRFSSSLAGTLNRIAAIGAWFHAGHASCARARRCRLV